MEDYSFDAVIFDLDGVVTKTALVHAQAWKETFDEYLRFRQQRDGEEFKEFAHDKDYLPFVDGKPRYEGVRSFLQSRGINIEYGDPKDEPDKETICGIGNKKNQKFRQVLETQGVQVFDSTIEFIKQLKAVGIKVGVASSSKNCRHIIETAGIEYLFQTRVDGVVSSELGLKGKPEGDIFVKAAFNLGALPARSVVVEDATSGVAAGRNGAFALVIGLARKDNVTELLDNGADIAVTDLDQIDISWIQQWFNKCPLPLFDEERREQNKYVLENKNSRISINHSYLIVDKTKVFSRSNMVFFLDYDGTLTPIVEKPELAVLSEDMRSVLKRIVKKYKTSIVSGRMREDVEDFVKIEGIFYAGSHGFDIKGPGISLVQPEAKEAVPVISEIIDIFNKSFKDIPGLLVEDKKFSVAVHYRLVDEKRYFSKIKDLVDKVIKENPSFQCIHGKKVFEVLPRIDWNKGKAVRWIMDALGLRWDNTNVFYFGDDTTDEDAFRMVRTRGIGVLISNTNKVSSADFYITSPDDVKKIFEELA